MKLAYIAIAGAGLIGLLVWANQSKAATPDDTGSPGDGAGGDPGGGGSGSGGYGGSSVPPIMPPLVQPPPPVTIIRPAYGGNVVASDVHNIPMYESPTSLQVNPNVGFSNRPLSNTPVGGAAPSPTNQTSSPPVTQTSAPPPSHGSGTSSSHNSRNPSGQIDKNAIQNQHSSFHADGKTWRSQKRQPSNWRGVDGTNFFGRPADDPKDFVFPVNVAADGAINWYKNYRTEW